MSYADGLLATGERIVHREKQHPLVFIWGAKWPLAAFIGGLILLFVTTQIMTLSSPWSEVFAWLSALLVIGGLILFGWHALRYMNQEYALTNRRVIQVEGVLNKRSAESSLEKINDAELSQSVFGRIFDFGDLEILTASESGIDQFRMLRAPIEFKKAMLDAKYAYEHGGDQPGAAPMSPALRSDVAPSAAAASAAAAAPVGDETVSTPTPMAAAAPAVAKADAMDPDEVTRTLNSLADLRDRGAITTEEYERKKADLLGRL